MPQIVAMTVGVTHNTHRKRERESLQSGVCWGEIDILERMLGIKVVCHC